MTNLESLSGGNEQTLDTTLDTTHTCFTSKVGQPPYSSDWHLPLSGSLTELWTKKETALLLTLRKPLWVKQQNQKSIYIAINIKIIFSWRRTIS